MEPDSPTDEDKKPKQEEGKNYLHISLLCRRISVRKGRDIFKSSKQSKVLWNTIKPLLPKGGGGGEVFDTQKKEGRVWIRELLPPCVNIFGFAYFFASLILNSR